MEKPKILSDEEIRVYYLGSRLTAVKDVLTAQLDDTYKNILRQVISDLSAIDRYVNNSVFERAIMGYIVELKALLSKELKGS